MSLRILCFVGALASPAVAFADPCTAPLPKAGTEFSGPVRYVGDGDSLCVGATADPRTWVEVRLADFYAPELKAPQGRRAKAALSQLALGRRLDCKSGKRSYDRVVANCRLRGAAVGDLLRKRGVPEGGRGADRRLRARAAGPTSAPDGDSP